MRPGQPDWYPLVSRAMDGGPDASGKLVLAFVAGYVHPGP